MNINTKKGPIFDPGLCRCCGEIKKCRLLNVEYEWRGQKEIYSDMFVDCFGLLLSHLDGEDLERLICATCVSRLREASSFRQQVLHCEEKLLRTKIHDEENPNANVKESKVKEELDSIQIEYHDDTLEYLDNDTDYVKDEALVKPKRKSLRQKLKAAKKVKTVKKEDVLTKKMLYDAQRLKKKLKSMQDIESTKTPRKKNKNKTGVRKYGVKSNYTPEALEEALNNIRSGAMSRQEASQHYRIPAFTLLYKLEDKHNKNVGRPVTFTDSEEKYLENHLLMLSDKGVTMNMLDFRLIVKRYLDSNDKKIATFKNNLPGYDWVVLFLERHPVLKNVIGKGSQTKHLQVDKQNIEKFFGNISKEIHGISPNNIYSIDELGFNENLDKHKVIFRRDSRNLGYIKNELKSSYTVAFCGNAAGKILPPYFIFKEPQSNSDPLFQIVSGFRTAVSNSGWFNNTVFEDWLEFNFIPFANKRKGKKLLFCDNLSAHISPRCMNLCVDNNIKFICLLPNSTFLLQPFDGVFFKTIESIWKKFLGEYCITNNVKMVPLTKILFIRLLKIILRNKEILSANIEAGFRSCGLYPFSPRTVLNKLPHASENRVLTCDMSELDENSATYLETNPPDINSIIEDGEFEVAMLDDVMEEDMKLDFEKTDELVRNIEYLKIQPKKRGRPRKNDPKGTECKNNDQRFENDEMYDSDEIAKKKVKQNSGETKYIDVSVQEEVYTKVNEFESSKEEELLTDLSSRLSDNDYTDVEVLDLDLLS